LVDPAPGESTLEAMTAADSGTPLRPGHGAGEDAPEAVPRTFAPDANWSSGSHTPSDSDFDSEVSVPDSDDGTTATPPSGLARTLVKVVSTGSMHLRSKVRAVAGRVRRPRGHAPMGAGPPEVSAVSSPPRRQLVMDETTGAVIGVDQQPVDDPEAIAMQVWEALDGSHVPLAHRVARTLRGAWADPATATTSPSGAGVGLAATGAGDSEVVAAGADSGQGRRSTPGPLVPPPQGTSTLGQWLVRCRLQRYEGPLFLLGVLTIFDMDFLLETDIDALGAACIRGAGPIVAACSDNWCAYV